MNLETKLSRLESANEKLNKAYEQNHDEEGAGEFQLTLDEEGKFIDGVIDKVSQLKVLKGELEQRPQESERTLTGNSDNDNRDAGASETGTYTANDSLFAAASMNLREWISNSQEFMTVLPQEDKVSNISNTHKILGI